MAQNFTTAFGKILLRLLLLFFFFKMETSNLLSLSTFVIKLKNLRWSNTPRFQYENLLIPTSQRTDLLVFCTGNDFFEKFIPLEFVSRIKLRQLSLKSFWFPERFQSSYKWTSIVFFSIPFLVILTCHFLY